MENGKNKTSISEASEMQESIHTKLIPVSTRLSKNHFWLFLA